MQPMARREVDPSPVRSLTTPTDTDCPERSLAFLPAAPISPRCGCQRAGVLARADAAAAGAPHPRRSLQRQFATYAPPETAVVWAVGRHDMTDRQPDLVVVMGGVVLLVNALAIGQLWLLLPWRRPAATRA